MIIQELTVQSIPFLSFLVYDNVDTMIIQELTVQSIPFLSFSVYDNVDTMIIQELTVQYSCMESQLKDNWTNSKAAYIIKILEIFWSAYFAAQPTLRTVQVVVKLNAQFCDIRHPVMYL